MQIIDHAKAPLDQLKHSDKPRKTCVFRLFVITLS